MRLRGFWEVCLAVSLGTIACMAQRGPHIAYVYPAGGQQGSSFEVIIAGRFLSGPTNVYFSGWGISGKIVDYSRPLTGKELMFARQELKKLQEKKGVIERSARRGPRGAANEASTNLVWTVEDEKMLGSLRNKIAKANRPANSELAEPVTVELSIEPNAKPGRREVRLQTAAGLSNPLVFHVGQLPEVTEEAGAPDNRPRYGRTSSNQPMRSQSAQQMNITTPCVANGQIMPGGTDKYRFAARKGERLVIATQARALIPYLANAVPGWFQPTVTLYDSDGRELAYQDDFLFDPDPVIYFEVPADGEHVVEIRDSIYRGREDFTYRLTIAEAPFVANVFPLGGRAGETVAVSLNGWNLPTNRIEAIAACDAWLTVTNRGLISNPVAFAVGEIREEMEREGKRRALELPVVINGRIDPPGEADVFQFAGRRGRTIVAEVHARRLNSPLDSMLTLVDSEGNQIAANDDHEDKAAGLTSHHADSYLTCELPRDGTYSIRVTDAQTKGGAEYGYRLRLSSPRPDFEMRVAPSTVNLRPGSGATVTVYALRRDGFTNEIQLSIRGGGEGFRLTNPVIPAGQTEAKIAILAEGRVRNELLKPVIEGRAFVGEREIIRAVAPADDVMQAFAYRHLVPAQEFVVYVRGRGGR